jgi:hypothetical protein
VAWMAVNCPLELVMDSQMSLSRVNGFRRIEGSIRAREDESKTGS